MGAAGQQETSAFLLSNVFAELHLGGDVAGQGCRARQVPVNK